MFNSSFATRQPTSSVAVNWSNPVTRGMRLLLPLRHRGDVRNVVTGQSGTASALSDNSSTFGTAPLFGTGSFVDFVTPPGITTSTAVTFAWIQEPRSPTGFGTILNWKPPGATDAFAIYQSTPSGNSAYRFCVGPRSGINVVNFNTQVGFTTDRKLDFYVLVCRGGTTSFSTADYTLYRNGVRLDAETPVGAFGINSNASNRIGALDSGGDVFEGLISNFIIWDRPLNHHEALSLSMNPWQVYDSGNRRLWIPTTVGGNNFSQSISGSLTINGVIRRSVNKGVTGSLTGSGTLRRDMSVRRVGSLTASASVIRNTSVRRNGSITTSAGPVVSAGINQNISGSITLSSVLSDTITYVRSYASSITLSGTIVKPVFKRLTGVIQLTGGLVKRITKSVFGGVLTLSSTLSGFKFTPPPIGPVLTRGIRFLRKFLGRR